MRGTGFIGGKGRVCKIFETEIDAGTRAKRIKEIKQKADRDKMNPVYKRFFDIEDSVKANRLETRERAIANGWETKIDENGHVVSDDVVSVSVDDIQADTESQETVDFTPKQEPVQQVESLENEKNVAGQTKHNFHYNLWEMEKGGAKTRYQWNMDAIRTLKQIESENRLATPEEQKTLSKFVGWGGLSQAFDEENAGWSKEYKELKEMLSDEEYAAARASIYDGRSLYHFDCTSHNCYCWHTWRMYNRYIFEKCRYVYGICISGHCF